MTSGEEWRVVDAPDGEPVITHRPEREEALRGLRNLEKSYSLGYAVDWYAREKGLNVLDMLDALAADLEATEREVKRQEDEKWAAENRADEAEVERDHYRFHFDQQEQRAEAAEREREDWHYAADELNRAHRRADAAERERDEAIEQARKFGRETGGYLHDLLTVQSDLATAREALWKYGEHTPDCNKGAEMRERIGAIGICTCGLSAALRSLGEKV